MNILSQNMEKKSKVFFSYGELLSKIPKDLVVLEVCSLLHTAELELKEYLDKPSISRELKLTENNIIIKINISGKGFTSDVAFFGNLKIRLAIALRRVNGGIGLYDYTDTYYQYFIVVPFGWDSGLYTFDK